MIIKGIIPALLLGLLLSGCTSNKKERPSPLRADSTTLQSLNLRVDFSSPSVRSRQIWGDLVPYGELWRTGANDASTFTTTGAVYLNGHLIDSGKYAILTIPRQTDWEVILNKNWDQWGTYHYDSTLDAARIKVIPRTDADFNEHLKFFFENDSLKFSWANMAFSLQLQ